MGIGLGDLDGDLDLDFALANFGGDDVSVLLYGCDACTADLDGSDVVDFFDVLLVLDAWGPCNGACPRDLDGSRTVDFGDLLIVLDNWS